MSYLFDPKAKDRSEKLRPVKFDGHNVELFREFEQSVLIRIINNKILDFDEKFLSLLETLGGSALAVAQSYAEEAYWQNWDADWSGDYDGSMEEYYQTGMW